jgi:ERCC4-related helicase
LDTWAIPSESRPGVTYLVRRISDDYYTCTCPHYTYRRQECKHIRLVKELLRAKQLIAREGVDNATPHGGQGALAASSPILGNPMIRWDRVQVREYQVRIAESALGRNTLVVLPTALGKTVIAAYVAAYYLLNYPWMKILMMAPTRPLVHQHYQRILELLRVKPSEAKILTGQLEPEYRLYWWRDPSIKIYFATPEVVRNDLELGLSLRDFSLLIFDEAHRARKEYAYTRVAEAYMSQSPCPVILALTASPGGQEKKVREILEKLYIEHIEYRSEMDPDVKPYVHGVETEYKVVDPPQSYGEYVKILREMLNEQLAKLMMAGLIKKDPEHVFRRDLLEVGDMLRYEIGVNMLDEERGRMWGLLVHQSMALIIYHAIDLLLSQGQYAFRNFLEKVMEERGRQSHRRLARDPRWRELVERMRRERLEEHPKIPVLIEVVKDQLRRAPGSRIIVFTQYRDSAQHIVDVLKAEGLRAEIFVGQGRRGRRRALDKAPALSQKQQLEILERFRRGDLSILVSTSIGEEGLDIPEVELVVFYEPVPSEIRFIQRRGRTGRVKVGRCVILVADKTLDMAYLMGATARLRKMRAIMDRLNKSLGEAKHRIWPEPRPMEAGYMEEADRELEDLMARRLEQATIMEAMREEAEPVKAEALKIPVEPHVKVFEEKAGGAEPVGEGPVEPAAIEPIREVGEARPSMEEISIVEPDEERLMYRGLQTIIKGVAKNIYRRVLKAGERGVSIPLLVEDLEYEGFDPATVRSAIRRLVKSGAILEEDERLYPAGKRILEKKRMGLYSGDAKVYRVYVEEMYPGAAVVVVNDRFRASVPMDFYDAPPASRSVWKKGKELKVLGSLVKIDGKMHLRVYDILEEVG